MTNSTSVEFCDTNVIAYAYDDRSPVKHRIATGLLQRLWEMEAAAVSIQVLQELFVTLTRKTSPPLSNRDARAIVSDLTAWQLVEPTGADVVAAIDSADRWHISFWDAMILTTAKKVGAAVLWSEDLNDGQDYDGVVVRNPFRAAAPA